MRQISGDVVSRLRSTRPRYPETLRLRKGKEFDVLFTKQPDTIRERRQDIFRPRRIGLIEGKREGIAVFVKSE